MVAVLRVALVLVVAACTVVPPDVETRRVRAHLEVALTEVAAHTPALSPAQRAARTRALADLRAYIDAEAYPTNDVASERTPIFIDRFGARCAMAALIEASGHRALVERIARDHLYAHIVDLGDDPELARWLHDHGLTLAEAARIQPSYSNQKASHWVPTGSLGVFAHLGIAHDGAGTEGDAWLLVGARLGARRITRTISDCDRCVYRTTAFVAEYQRRLAPSDGGSNIVGALIEHDLDPQSEDHQFYAIGGPIASIGDAARFGGKLGVGWSLRNRAHPVLAEVALVGLAQPGGFAAHVAFGAGAVW